MTEYRNNRGHVDAKSKSTKGLWGGRFKKEMHPLLKDFSYSLAVDGALFEAEILVDKAWAKMLAKVGLITKAEGAKLVRALHQIEKQWRGKPFCAYLDEYEDVHTLIQTALEKKTGVLGKKIHTGRSRNDLVVTSTRVYLKMRIGAIDQLLIETEKALVGLAERAGDSLVAGMTHLKKAQPVLMAHHLLAYVEMLDEDRMRLHDAVKRINVLPLGSAAIGGSALPLDQNFIAKELGFARISTNSMAAVSDRAFLVELMSVLAMIWMHLSRLSEDFILWNSEPFNYIELDDAFATGSSLMPQKKNPDVFELIRGRSAVVFGQLQALLTLQKGLPLAYNRDLQEDKPAVFEALKKTSMALELLTLTLESVNFNRAAMDASVEDDNLYATDVLEYLVRKGMAFSEAHETVGRAVRHSAESGIAMRDLPLSEWKRFSAKFDQGVYDLFNPTASVKAKKTIGSTNPGRVKGEISKWLKKLASS